MLIFRCCFYLKIHLARGLGATGRLQIALCQVEFDNVTNITLLGNILLED